jgi:hypothetical protein
MKFATIDRDIVVRKIGQLHMPERSSVRRILSEFFAES